jgi:hypothetical protein
MDAELKELGERRARGGQQDFLGRELDRYEESGGSAATMGQAYGLGLRNQETAATLGDLDLGGTTLMSSTNLPRKLRNIDREYEISTRSRSNKKLTK